MPKRSRNAVIAFIAWVLACLNASATFGQASDSLLPALRQWTAQNQKRIVDELIEFVRIPNVSANQPNIRRNAEHLLNLLKRRGLTAKLLEAPMASPLVYAELLRPGATSTWVFYAHYDGQPVEAREWASPPFEPTLRSGKLDQGGEVIPLPLANAQFDPEWRLYARAVADDKGPIIAMLAALDGVRAIGAQLKANLKFVFDGEEEIGSPNLRRILERHRELLGGDLWIICDGPQHQSGRTTVVFGVRGIQSVELTVYGANRELHSGHFGNWAPNPAMMLAQLVGSMKDRDGRIRISGFDAGLLPLSPAERAAIDAIPNDDSEQMRQLGLSRVEGSGQKLAELITLPALNVRGLSSGRTGAEAANAIPSTATASIDIRLVKGMTRENAVAALIRHIEKEGYHVTAAEPDLKTLLEHARVARVAVSPSGYNASRTPMNLPVAQRLVSALQKSGTPLVLQPTMGGSLPLSVIEEAVGAPTLIVPTVNHDNNQHAKNENLRLGHLWNAIETMAAMFTMD
ncbi:MAG: M20/M25/M40 family metallo-hydrolase [Verrucomicrobiota bacterium]